MSTQKCVRISLVVATSTFFVQPALALAQTAPTPGKTGPEESAPQRDGQRDFDPLIGTWKAKLRRLVEPLTGSTTWVEFEGTQITRSIWGGRWTNSTSTARRRTPRSTA